MLVRAARASARPCRPAGARRSMERNIDDDEELARAGTRSPSRWSPSATASSSWRRARRRSAGSSPRRSTERRRPVNGDYTFLVAMAAGLISFLSPCVLPLVPAYLGQLTAVAVAAQGAGAHGRPAGRRSATPSPTSPGFGAVFTLLGITAAFAGGAIADYIKPLRIIGGAVLVVMGLSLAGILQDPDPRAHLAAARRRRVGGPRDDDGRHGARARGWRGGRPHGQQAGGGPGRASAPRSRWAPCSRSAGRRASASILGGILTMAATVRGQAPGRAAARRATRSAWASRSSSSPRSTTGRGARARSSSGTAGSSRWSAGCWWRRSGSR